MSDKSSLPSYHIPGLKPDISFQRDDAYRFLPRMIALVMAMVAFMLLLAISLSSALTQTSSAQQGTILIHVPAQESQEGIAASIITNLAGSEHISAADILTSEQLIGQMQPWLGQIDHAEELPIPTLIRVELRVPYTPEILASIRTKMQTLDPSIITDAPAQWAENYSKFSITLQWVLFGFSAALLLSLLGLMSFVATTAMKLHRRTVILLHSIGATDNYIAAQFQANTALLAIKGAAIGCLIAAVIYGAVGAYVDALNADMLPDLGARWSHLFVIFALPLIAAIVGFISGRIASLNYLKRFM